jgi:UDP-2,3-diacylglucosamine hydrolase
VAAFESFCATSARAAAGLYVLGDLFDQWVGDDQLREPMAARIAAALRGVADSGVPVGIIVGNRDFLLGKRFAEAAGATLLPEQIVVDVAGTPTLLMHGDELCTSDVAYQRFRRISHDRRWQSSFLALPYGLRRGFANWLRRKSREATAVKPEDILDVESSAVDTAFRKANVARIVHGHTHRPAHHRLVVDGRACERHVLADWYDRGTYLEFGAGGARSREL